MMKCHDIILPILKEKVEFEFPYMLFQENNCQGALFDNQHPSWGVDIEIQKKKIGSLYVPPHAILQVFDSKNNLAEIHGPSTLSHTQASLLFWKHGPDQGKKINWNEISKIHVKRTKTWEKYLHDIAIRKKTVQYQGKTIEFDFDSFFRRICPSKKYKCQCHDAFQTFSQNHPRVPPLINNLSNECDPDRHYVPSKMKIGTQSEKECQDMFHKMVKHNTLETNENGPELFHCGGKVYSNASKRGIIDKNEIYDDIEDHELEQKEMPNKSIPSIVIYLLLGLFTFLFSIFVSFCIDRAFHVSLSSVKRNKKKII